MFSADHLLKLESGCIAGASNAQQDVRVFRGIPYAKPPVGNLRWRPPQPPEPWTGVRPSLSFGPRCVQVPIPKNSQAYFPPEPESEDCLYLNVWAPARSDGPWPVMVWFHGGSYARLSGSLPLFDGQALARRGIVLVTVNFRVGRLGFLAHPELNRESENGVSGNYCLMDQIAALQWVRRNIGHFGGDPDRVTIAGQSSGAYSACYLMIAPLAKALFHRVIGQSGAMFGPIGKSIGIGDTIQTLPAAEESGLAMARRLGASSIAELRSRSAQEIQFARPDDGLPDGPGYDPHAMPRGRGAFDAGNPNIDGYILPGCPRAIFAAGSQHDVPLLTGSTSHERGFTVQPPSTVEGMIEEAHRYLGRLAPRFLKLYPASTDAEAAEMGGYANGDRLFTFQNFFWAREHARREGAPAFLYRFTHIPPQPANITYIENPNRTPRAYHGAELPYLFGTFDALPYPWQPEDRHLSTTVSTYWANFIRSGDPNGNDLPSWPRFDPANPSMMFLKDKPEAGKISNMQVLEFWDEFYDGQSKSISS